MAGFASRGVWTLALGAALACGPRVEMAAEQGEGAGTSSLATTSVGTMPQPGSGSAEMPDADTTLGPASTSFGSGGDDEGVPFIVSPDGGPPGGCEQPEATEQAPTCDDGVVQPGELCYRGAASRYAMPEGVRLVDFGDGPRVAYVDLGYGAPLVPATTEGVLSGTAAFDPPGSEYGLAIEDVDGDGPLDLVIAFDSEAPHLTVFRGLGNGTFEEWTTSALEGMAHMQLADLDGDGRRDLVATTSYYYETGDLHLALAEAGGLYADAGVFDLGEYVFPNAEDLDGDTLADVTALVVTDWKASDREIVTLPMTPGGLGSATQLDAAQGLGRPVVGHFDADAAIDIVYQRDDELILRAGLGDGSFGPEDVIATGGVDAPLAAFDLDGGGLDEIIATSSIFVVATGEWVAFDVGCGHYATVLADAADVNGDGLLDIVLGTGYGQDVGAVHLVLSNP